MGKEATYKSGETSHSSCSFPVEDSNITLQCIAPEIDSLWDPSKAVGKELIKENGRVFLILRDQTHDTKVTLSGFERRGNKVHALFKRLLELRLITLDTRLISLLCLQADVWRRVAMSTALFSAEEAFILIVEAPAK
eukprot:TRINITY_DN6988_c0_g1_i10.p2 TRINITY_DN6988_c0_g1~~TRINITY_DN6988_c0_g1_i10.p2  ORF type:complete len:137 (+),score=23.56 TRINITY_DN6988_c0_g1_i10:106-516(+)